MQVEALQQRCIATDAQAAQLQQQLTELQGDKALLGARLHDGSLDMVKGQLIQQLQQQLADSSKAAEAAAGQSQQAALQLQSLQDQLSLQQQAQASERERLSMEAAQSRLLCKARARQVSSLELQCKAEVSCPHMREATLPSHCTGFLPLGLSHPPQPMACNNADHGLSQLQLPAVRGCMSSRLSADHLPVDMTVMRTHTSDTRIYPSQL